MKRVDFLFHFALQMTTVNTNQISKKLLLKAFEEGALHLLFRLYLLRTRVDYKTNFKPLFIESF